MRSRVTVPAMPNHAVVLVWFGNPWATLDIEVGAGQMAHPLHAGLVTIGGKGWILLTHPYPVVQCVRLGAERTGRGERSWLWMGTEWSGLGDCVPE